MSALEPSPVYHQALLAEVFKPRRIFEADTVLYGIIAEVSVL
jgi:hypothetical protein